jgi:hypothetical protein
MGTDPPGDPWQRIATVAHAINEMLAQEGMSIDQGVLALATVLEAMLRSERVPTSPLLTQAVETFCAEIFERSAGPH